MERKVNWQFFEISNIAVFAHLLTHWRAYTNPMQKNEIMKIWLDFVLPFHSSKSQLAFYAYRLFRKSLSIKIIIRKNCMRNYFSPCVYPLRTEIKVFVVYRKNYCWKDKQIRYRFIIQIYQRSIRKCSTVTNDQNSHLFISCSLFSLIFSLLNTFKLSISELIFLLFFPTYTKKKRFG